MGVSKKLCLLSVFHYCSCLLLNVLTDNAKGFLITYSLYRRTFFLNFFFVFHYSEQAIGDIVSTFIFTCISEKRLWTLQIWACRMDGRIRIK